jgi:hypothetical protein
MIGMCRGSGSLREIADALLEKLSHKEIVADDVLSWLLESHPEIVESSHPVGWRLIIFIEGLLCRSALSGGTISGTIGLVDR